MNSSDDRQLLIFDRLKNIRKEIGDASLIAVTKYSGVEDIYFAHQGLQIDFGENRVQDLKEKAQYFHDKNIHDIRWHMIGHLQSNKVKDLLRIPNLYAIHSVDSIKLLEELLKREDEFEGFDLKIFFQVNTSHEEEKSGFESIEELKAAIALLLSSNTKLKFYGLMTIGTVRTEEPEKEAHRCFKEMLELKRSIETEYNLTGLKLSMGMSSDFKIALQYESDFIRVGTSIFK